MPIEKNPLQLFFLFLKFSYMVNSDILHVSKMYIPNGQFDCEIYFVLVSGCSSCDLISVWIAEIGIKT